MEQPTAGHAGRLLWSHRAERAALRVGCPTVAGVPSCIRASPCSCTIVASALSGSRIRLRARAAAARSARQPAGRRHGGRARGGAVRSPRLHGARARRGQLGGLPADLVDATGELGATRALRIPSAAWRASVASSSRSFSVSGASRLCPHSMAPTRSAPRTSGIGGIGSASASSAIAAAPVGCARTASPADSRSSTRAAHSRARPWRSASEIGGAGSAGSNDCARLRPKRVRTLVPSVLEASGRPARRRPPHSIRFSAPRRRAGLTRRRRR
jgi:hypothetical protein